MHDLPAEVTLCWSDVIFRDANLFSLMHDEHVGEDVMLVPVYKHSMSSRPYAEVVIKGDIDARAVCVKLSRRGEQTSLGGYQDCCIFKLNTRLIKQALSYQLAVYGNDSYDLSLFDALPWMSPYVLGEAWILYVDACNAPVSFNTVAELQAIK
jgi:hypothetical protein